MSTDFSDQRRTEQAFWNTQREQQGVTLLNVEEVRANELRPCYQGRGDLYSENRELFHEIIMQDGGWENRRTLDYCCGLGSWAVYFGLTGATEVVGFDMGSSGIDIGREHVAKQNLEDKVKLVVADATSLPFPDNDFDIVIGHGVIHHTIKYPGIFEDLYRVMKPGSKAYFQENLADFPLWRMWWKIKGEVPDGDVPIFSEEVREKAHMFGEIKIIGDSFFHSIKTIVYCPNMGKMRRGILWCSHNADKVLFRLFPGLRKWGSMSVIVLTKL